MHKHMSLEMHFVTLSLSHFLLLLSSISVVVSEALFHTSSQSQHHQRTTKDLQETTSMKHLKDGGQGIKQEAMEENKINQDSQQHQQSIASRRVLNRDLFTESIRSVLFPLSPKYSHNNVFTTAAKDNRTQDPSIPRILLVTYFRSGSSFLGDLLQSTPRTFYSFEPLHFMTSGYRAPSERLEEAFYVMNKLFSCSFPELSFYIKWALNADHRFLFKWNNFLWNSCRNHRRLCYNPSFLKGICLKASVHLMKVTRLHMKQVKEFIDREDEKILSWKQNKRIQDKKSLDESKEGNKTSRTKALDQTINTKDRTEKDTEDQMSKLLSNQLKVVLLVRDPRGIYSSRKSLYWCKKDSCLDPSLICQEMEEDLKEFDRLHSQDPDRFTLIRYEDLSLNPEKEAVYLFQRLSLTFSKERLGQFLRSHTSLPSGHSNEKEAQDNPYSTTRDSRTTAFEWIKRLTPEEVSSVQTACFRVMDRIGYKMLPASESHENEKVNFLPET